MKALVHELSRLVGYPTVSNRPVIELAAHLARRHEDQGLRVERFDAPYDASKCNIVASVGPPATDGLVLTGHMDVVPTEGQPWASDPFVLTERAGRLHGRGTADMKGFIAATLAALDRIDPAEYRRELVIIWTHDEEVGCLGSAWLADALLEAERVIPTACLVGEPTSFAVHRMHLGHVVVHIDVEGRAAHSSRPDLGANAIETAGLAIDAVHGVARELQTERHLESFLHNPWVPVNIANIRGGSAINIVPDSCHLEVGYRPLPGMASDQVFHRIDAALESLRLAHPKTPIHAHIHRRTPSLLTPEGTPLQALLAPYATNDEPGVATFATDGGNLSRLGTQPLIFGPGDINVAHRANEFVPTDELHRAVELIEQLIRARCC